MAPVADLDNGLCPTFSPEIDNYVSTDCKYFNSDDFHCYSYETFNLLMFNVRSCRKNFSNFLSCFSNVLTYFTCIVLVETWLTQDRDVSYAIPGFYNYDIYRDQYGGGIKMYVKDGIQTRILDEYTFLTNLFEVLTVEFIFNCKKIICSATYHPPSSSHVNNNDFVLNYSSFLRRVLGHHTPALICGDFNMNLFNPNKYAFVDGFVSSMFELGIVPLITIPTKINLENPTTRYSLLDQIWVTTGNDVKRSFVIPVDITDHYAVGTSIDLHTGLRTAQPGRETRFFNERCQITFGMFLRNFILIIIDGNMNDIFDHYFNKIFYSYEKAFPLTKMKELKTDPAPWMTRKLKECIKRKSRLYKLYLKGKIPKVQYTTFRNKLTGILRKARRLYYLKMFYDAGKSPSRLWCCINNIIDKKKTLKLESITVDGIALVGRNLANHANGYFVTAAASLIGNMVQPVVHVFLTPPILSTCFLYPATAVEVQTIILGLKNKGNKIVDISPVILKKHYVLFSDHFSILYNVSIEKQEYPDTLKKARVTPIHKAGSADNMDNYRPISVLPVISKIFEKLTLNRMESFIAANSILTACQFGFRRGRSTTHAIITLLSYIQAAFHKKTHCVCFFLDLKKAFDTVSHHILLKKLAHYGFRGSSHEYLQSYFKNRKQYVSLNGENSDLRDVICGVPQGSILGPLCFSLFINDLPLAVEAHTVLFADDAAFVLTSSSLEGLHLKIKKLFSDLESYLKVNMLIPNSRKSKLMFFTSRPSPNLPDFLFSGEVIEWVKEFKYLGLTLTNALSYARHINNITLNISRVTGTLVGLKDFIPTYVMIKLYYALALPYISNHLIVWGSAPASHLSRLKARVNNLLRMILGVEWINGIPQLSSEEMYKELKILRLHSQYKYNLFKFLKQLIRGQFPDLYDLLLRPYHRVDRYGTRGGIFRHPNLVCEVERRFLPHQLIMLNDSLHSSLIDSSLPKALREYKSLLLNNQ